MRINIFLFILCASSHIFGQSIDVKINWESNKEKGLYFENAIYNQQNENIPVYNKSIPISSHMGSLSVKVINYKTEPLSDDQIKLVSNTKLSNIQLKSDVLSSGKDKYLVIEFAPVIFDSVYKKITSVNIEVKPVNSTKSLKKSLSVNNSVLENGDWYKAGIYASGVYKITYSKLVELGFSSPQNIRIYGNGGKLVPKFNGSDRPVDLNEIPIYMKKGDDGVFNGDDFILFYAEGTKYLVYDSVNNIIEQEIHDYAKISHVFLTTSLGEGKRIESRSPVSDEIEYSTNSYDYVSYYETSKYNLLQTGRQWFSRKFFSTSNTYDTTVIVSNKIDSYPIKLKFGVAARSSNNTSFNFYLNDTQEAIIPMNLVDIFRHETRYADYKTYFSNSLLTSGDEINLQFQYNFSQLADEAWFDFFTLNCRRNLTYDNSPLFFQDINAINNVSQFNISSATDVHIWNITNINDIYEPFTQSSGSEKSFKIEADTVLNYFVALKYNYSFQSPELNADLPEIGWIENQNIRNTSAVDYLIITHPKFLNGSLKIKEIHAKYDSLNTTVVSTDKIYNEYSSGAFDAAAIRDFIKDVYDKSNGNLKYLLLVGDGSYNNLSNDSLNNNYIPTYQSLESILNVASYVSDDFYGLLSDNEGEINGKLYGLVDLGVGRLPMTSTEHINIYIDKLDSYLNNAKSEPWHNNITLIADDQDGGAHMRDAEAFEEIIEEKYPEFLVNKIYLDAYEQISSTNGNRYPDVNTAIDNALLTGQYIVNYSGHGGPEGLAHERVITKQQIKSWRNKNKYPICVTATCEVSRYDLVDENLKVELTTAGELILLQKEAGAIAMFTTTRLVYQSFNSKINKSFYENLFNTDEFGNYYCIGDVIRFAKIDNNNDNSRNFTLLGDPALPLLFPVNKVITDSINNIPLELFNDTIKAFDTLYFTGHIENQYGEIQNDFNGTNYIKVFDKPRTFTTLDNDRTGAFQFDQQKDILFNGRSSVKNGHFTCKFIVPRDISFQLDYGKLSYYATTFDSSSYANGYSRDIVFGGISNNTTADITGPSIKLFINDTLFKDGGLTNSNPNIFAIVEDENGINTSSYGIGHDIIAYLDDNSNEPFILNDYYLSEIDNFKKGYINYPLSNLSEGLHYLTVRVWDTYNNSAESTISFYVASAENIQLSKIFNYPNPFKDHTYFKFEHNSPDEELEVIIKVYNMNGQLAKIINTTTYSSGFVSEPIYSDLSELSGGIYTYTINVKNAAGQSFTARNKLIKWH